MNIYQCWHIDIPQEYVEAASSFAARQAFAKKHHKQVSECMARWRAEAPDRHNGMSADEQLAMIQNHFNR